MIEFTKEIEEILNDNHIENIKESSFELEEEQQEQEDMVISIENLPKQGLKIKLPSGVHSAIIRESSKNRYKKSCDYLLVIPDENHIIDVYFIELKKTFSGEDPYIQILFTIPIWDYIVSMIKIKNIEKKEIIKEIKEFKIRLYFVIVTEEIKSRFNKQDTRPKPIIEEEREYKEEEHEYKGEKFKVIQTLENILFENLKCQTPS